MRLCMLALTCLLARLVLPSLCTCLSIYLTGPTASAGGLTTLTLKDLLRKGVPPLCRKSRCTPSSGKQSVSTGSPSSNAAVRAGEEIRLEGEWRVHAVDLQPPTVAGDVAQRRTSSWNTLEDNSKRSLGFENEASLQEEFKPVLQDLLGIINVRDVVDDTPQHSSVHNYQEVIPDVTFFDRRTGLPVLHIEYKVPATDRGTHAHSKPDVAAQLRLQCDRQYFLGIEHPCVVLLDGATMSVAWREGDDNKHFQNLIGATSTVKRNNWLESFRHTLWLRPGERRVADMTPTRKQRKDPKQVTPPRQNYDLCTPVYADSPVAAAGTSKPGASAQAPPPPPPMGAGGPLTHLHARMAQEAGAAIAGVACTVPSCTG